VDEFEAVEILLVEDSDADAELITRALRKSNLVNKVVRLRDGVEAIEFVFREGAFSQRRGGQPRLILLDLKMPRLGGIDVLKRLKADERTKVIPVVVLTSSAEEQDVLSSYQLGVNSYLVKPVEFSAFTSVITQTGLYWAVMNRIPNQRPCTGKSRYCSSRTTRRTRKCCSGKCTRGAWMSSAAAWIPAPIMKTHSRLSRRT
jgi:two-component system, response regulator